eukprot:g31979.t1
MASGSASWVTVFGFPGRAASGVRQQLEAVCGPIVEVCYGEGNFMHVCFGSPQAASACLALNGQLLLGKIMVGCIPCTHAALLAGESEQPEARLRASTASVGVWLREMGVRIREGEHGYSLAPHRQDGERSCAAGLVCRQRRCSASRQAVRVVALLQFAGLGQHSLSLCTAATPPERFARAGALLEPLLGEPGWATGRAAEVFQPSDQDAIERGRALSCVLCNLLTKTVLDTHRLNKKKPLHERSARTLGAVVWGRFMQDQTQEVLIDFCSDLAKPIARQMDVIEKDVLMVCNRVVKENVGDMMDAAWSDEDLANALWAFGKMLCRTPAEEAILAGCQSRMEEFSAQHLSNSMQTFTVLSSAPVPGTAAWRSWRSQVDVPLLELVAQKAAASWSEWSPQEMVNGARSFTRLTHGGLTELASEQLVQRRTGRGGFGP